MGSFSSISLSVAADLYLIQENDTKVVIEGAQKALDQIVTKVDGGIWKIKLKPGVWNIFRNKKVKIYVSTPDVEGLYLSGSGDLFAEDFKTDDVEIRISGSGTCKVTAVSTLEAHISGSGSVYYKGNPMVEAKVSGSGKVRSLD